MELDVQSKRASKQAGRQADEQEQKEQKDEVKCQSGVMVKTEQGWERKKECYEHAHSRRGDGSK